MSCFCSTADPIDAPNGSTPVLTARIEARDGDELEPVVQADVDEIVYSVRDLDDPDPTTGVYRESSGGAIVVADAIFDTLQTGDLWDEDGIGYNFLFQLPAAAIDHDSHRFLAEVAIRLQDDSIQMFRFPINAQPAYTSFD